MVILTYCFRHYLLCWLVVLVATVPSIALAFHAAHAHLLRLELADDVTGGEGNALIV